MFSNRIFMANNKSVLSNRIRSFRIFKGYSQEYLAKQLGIDQAKYSKMESGNTVIKNDMLERIAEILEVSAEDLSSNEPLIIQNNSSTIGAQGKFENYYAEQKEVYEKLIETQRQEIQRLSKQVEQLMKMLEKK
jgi:transcriptional regulator with XRE-family HTH domain